VFVVCVCGVCVCVCVILYYSSDYQLRASTLGRYFGQFKRNEILRFVSCLPETDRKSSLIYSLRENRQKTSGFHGGDYEECRLLGCYAMCFCEH
jgi:hypothetical protein